jgi:hypothetical protein
MVGTKTPLGKHELHIITLPNNILNVDAYGTLSFNYVFVYRLKEQVTYEIATSIDVIWLPNTAVYRTRNVQSLSVCSSR